MASATLQGWFSGVQRTGPASVAHIQRLNEVLLSLNLALAFLYALTVYSFGNWYSQGTSNAFSFLYCFFRAAVRLNNLLHYHPALNEKYIKWPDAGGRLGVELAFALSTVCLGAVFLTIFQSIRGSRLYNAVQRSVAGLVYFLAFPAIYVLLFEHNEPSAMRSTSSVARLNFYAPAFCLLSFCCARSRFGRWAP